MSEIKSFKAEVKKVLDLVIHSLYTNKDIFLRELISNASDAIDKARFESVTKPEIAQKWKITIEIDRKNCEIRISDNGIGMNEAEIEENLGTIAKSGTKAFLEKLTENKETSIPELIGQFGVGFYSAFMVAEEIIVESKRAGTNDPAVVWRSRGEEGYELSAGTRTEQGTGIRLKLKPNNDEYLEPWKIKEIVRKYSDFIEYPIHLVEVGKGSQKEEAEKPINSMKAIWMKKPEEVSDEEYEQFFAHLSHFGKEPLARIHFSAEGTSNFKALIYIPAEAPPFFISIDEHKRGLHLYVKRVFITDSCEELIPAYLSFVKGVVESDDLPLNVSREMLQKNPQIEKINRNITRKVLSELSSLLDKDREKYIKFYNNFGRMLKEGINTDFQNREKLLDLLLFETSNGEADKKFSLKEIIETLPPGQDKIYYAIGDDIRSLRNSPLLDAVRKNSFNAILTSDPLDEYVFQTVQKYKDKEFISLNQDNPEIAKSAELDELKNQAEKKYSEFLDAMKKAIGEKVKDVRFSSRLVSAPCCLVGEQFAPSRQMERIMKAMKMSIPESKRILELNPTHPLIKSSAEKYLVEKNDGELANFANLIYDIALISDGEAPEDPSAFVNRIVQALSIQSQNK